MGQNRDTTSAAYTRRLAAAQGAWWKRILDVQAPYRWNLRRLRPGYTLEIGCGIGRNLDHLRGNAVGLDHNRDSIEMCRLRGFAALTSDEFEASPFNIPARFDSLLLAHVVEHMRLTEAIALIRHYLPNLKPGGAVILIAPQEQGFKSDATHVEFMHFGKLQRIQDELGLASEQAYSFPFPRFVGLLFKYNEFVSVSRKASAPLGSS